MGRGTLEVPQNRHELLTFLISSCDKASTPPPSLKSAQMKAKSKRKLFPATSSPAKRPYINPEDCSTVSSDPVLSAVIEIKESINKLDNRVSALDKPNHCTSNIQASATPPMVSPRTSCHITPLPQLYLLHLRELLSSRQQQVFLKV